MKTIEMRVLSALQPHPRNTALYGNEHGTYDDKLVESLRAGIWPGEIQVTTGNVIISGHRRCEHAIFANIESAEVWVRTDLPEDPTSPQVLEALLQANLQRNKSNEQKLREFALWKEVERELAKGRKSTLNRKSAPGEKHQEQKTGTARDLAAKRVGIGSGSDAEKAYKALMAADQAEASGDAGLMKKAKEVKIALEKGITAATRKAKETGLIEARKPIVEETPKPLTPTGKLSDATKLLIKREKQLMAERIEYVNSLRNFDAMTERYWKHLQREYQKQGRSILAQKMQITSKALQQDKTLLPLTEALGISADSSHKDCLLAMAGMAKKLEKSVNSALQLAGYLD
jgi:hypothetical protein